MKVQIFRIIAVDNIPERFGEIERLRMRGRLAEVELRERKQMVHERFQLGFLGVNRLQIARPCCFVLRHAVEQTLGIGADGGERAFEVVRHTRDQLLLLLLLAALRVERRFQPRGHFVHGVARGPEFVRSRIADGRVQIAVPP